MLLNKLLLNNPSMTELKSMLASPPDRNFRIQFSEPAGYDAARLTVVNEICRKAGPKVSIRFYAHYSSAINCAVATGLTACRSLFFDSHQPLQNVDAIASMSPLDTFGINVFDANHDEVLNFPNVRSASTIYIGTNRRLDWNLAPLSEFDALKILSLSGQHRNIGVVGDLQGIESLSLNSIPRKASLAFVSRMRRLKRLALLLGGREEMDEINHSGITELEVIWVKGLRRLPLSLFPAVEVLKVENQAKLTELDLSRNSELRRAHVDNCKSLKQIQIKGLEKLSSLFVGRTAIEPEIVLASPLPATLSAFDLYGYGRKRDAEIEAIIRSRGYRPVYRDEAH